jgi:stage V sporulation protein SpoVS
MEQQTQGANLNPPSNKIDEDKGIVLLKILSPRVRLNLRVSANTPVKSLAGSIYNAVIKDHRDISLTFVGHGAAGQALKGLIAAQQMMSPSGLILVFRGAFEKDIRNVKEGDEELSIMKIIVYTIE